MPVKYSSIQNFVRVPFIDLQSRSKLRVSIALHRLEIWPIYFARSAAIGSQGAETQDDFVPTSSV